MISKILVGNNLDLLASLPALSVQCVITSPPYWNLRNYGHEDQLGIESNYLDYVENLCKVFDEVWRVLKDDGTVWLNLGDNYQNKNLMGIPWKVAFALQERGWYLRQDIIWAKPNPVPESVNDRCTKSHEYIFLLSKSKKYYFDNKAISEPSSEFRKFGNRIREKPVGESIVEAKQRGKGNNMGVTEKRNKRDVWLVPTKPFKGAHFATYPTTLIEPCVLAGTKKGDVILDPFSGSGTTGIVALQNDRSYIGIELNPEYAEISINRLASFNGEKQ